MSVTSVNTTLANGTDNQVFCYDSLNPLVWAGSTGTPNCARTLTPGTLTSANYTATYAYDATNRLTSGSLGTLSYGDSSHFHAATSSSSGETTTYDAAGDMQCRAPTSAVTCAGGSPTGARLDYDAERRLTHWQNAQSSPTVQAWYLYDGSGQRVEQYVSGGSGNHTYYLPGGVEEVTPSGSLIKYYSAGGTLLGLNTARDASGISYLASDGLGSVSEALSQSGTATGAVLYSPYGGVRYTSGTMPTSKGFTGQYADTASSGLDYYGARYYDPSLGQFTSADTVADGINRYGYVKGNPETATDPTGHRIDCNVSMCGGHPGSTPPPPTCSNDATCGCYTSCGGGNTTGGCHGNIDCSPNPTQQAGTKSPKTPPAQSCDAECKAATQEGQTDIGVGLFKLLGSLVLMGGACWFEVACAGWMRFMMPIFLSGIHQILDGIDILHQISGSVADGVSLLVRSARVAVDVLQVIIGASNLMAVVGKIGGVIQGLKGLGQVVAAGLSADPEAEGNAFGAAAGAIFDLADLGGDVAKDLREFQETQLAYAQSHS